MNKEDYVSLEVAKLLKEKGYEYITAWAYNLKFNNLELAHESNVRLSKIRFSAPTLYEAQKWLWKEKQLLVTSFLDEPFAEPYQFLWSIQDAKNEIDNYGNVISKCKYDSYEEALNAGLLEALKTI